MKCELAFPTSATLATRQGRVRDRRHLIFVPLGGDQVRPDELQVTVTNEQVRSARASRSMGCSPARDNASSTWLAWLLLSPAKPKSRHMLEHIERLRAWQGLALPAGIERQVHQNRLLEIAREGAQMTPADLAKFEPQRHYATLVAQAIEGQATVTDEIIDLHDRIVGTLFNAAKHKHQEQFQASGKAINDKVRLYGRALVQAGRPPTQRTLPRLR
jgi:hypothetical protein